MYTKDLSVSLLMDFYGEILTEKQREVITLYYDDDLSLSEIADEANITRQGVRDSIKRGETTLREMEEKLKLVERFKNQNKKLQSISDSAAKIIDINTRFRYNAEIGELAKKIQDETAELSE